MKVTKLHVALFLIILALVSVALTFTFLSLTTFKDVQIIEFDVNVQDRHGFNLDKDKLHFGTLPPGGSGQRAITINHAYEYPLTMVFDVPVDYLSWFSFDVDSLMVLPGESKNITITVHVPDDTPYGLYEGQIKVIFRK